MVETWDAFTNLRRGLIAGGTFSAPRGPALHKLRHVPTNLPLDIVPFGGIERADRTIAWPPTQDEIFDCFGAREALEASVEVLLPEGVKVQKLWNYCNVLRDDGMSYGDYVEQLTYPMTS